MKKLASMLVLLASGSVAAGQDLPVGAPDKAAVAYWTAGYAGAELTDVGCVAPALPAAPLASQQIRGAGKAIQQWEDCHRRLVAALGPAVADKYIPADVLAAMTADERALAVRHVAAVHGQVAAALQAQAAPVIARHDAWRDAHAQTLAHDRAEHADLLASSRNRMAATMARSGERAEQNRASRRSLN